MKTGKAVVILTPSSARKRIGLHLVGLAAVLAAACGDAPEPEMPEPETLAEAASPVDPEVRDCADCHDGSWDRFAPEHHGLYLEPLTPESAAAHLAPITRSIEAGDVEFTIIVDDREGRVVETEPDGDIEHPISWVLPSGGRSYVLASMERGRLRLLPVAYDAGKGTWIDVSDASWHAPAEAEKTGPRSPLGPAFDTSCARCHGTPLAIAYDMDTDGYRVERVDEEVDCEACHTGMENHLRSVEATTGGGVPAELGIATTPDLDAGQVEALCLPCHLAATPITASFPRGDRLFDHLDPVGLEHPGFSADGRIVGEQLTLTTWLLAPCARSGKLDCLHCHTAAGEFRHAADPNRACAPCHEDKVSDPAAHSMHAPDSDGSLCVSCHMPASGTDRRRRHDHSMRPPTPKATLAFKSPNACNDCHDDNSAGWANRWVDRWRGPTYQDSYLRQADLVDAGRKGDWSRRRDMERYVHSSDRDEIFAASLIRLLRGCDDPRRWPAIRSAADDRSPLVRAAAAEALGDDTDRASVAALVKAATDEYRVVRVRAAEALANLTPDLVSPAARKKAERALAEYVASLQARPDDAGARSDLGRYRLRQGELDKAVRNFGAAVRLRPDHAAYRVELARAMAMSGRAAEAENSLRSALDLGPADGALYVELGRVLETQERSVEAADAYRAALGADPGLAEAAYRLGTIVGDDFPADGLRWFRRAAELRPGEPRYAFAVAVALGESGDADEAIAILNEMIFNHPAFADAWFALGQAYEDRGELDTARGVYLEGSENGSLPDEVRRRLGAKARRP